MIASHVTFLFGQHLCCHARSAAMVGEDLIASKSEAIQSSHVMHLRFHQYHLADQSRTLHSYKVRHHLGSYETWLKRGSLRFFGWNVIFPLSLSLFLFFVCSILRLGSFFGQQEDEGMLLSCCIYHFDIPFGLHHITSSLSSEQLAP